MSIVNNIANTFLLIIAIFASFLAINANTTVTTGQINTEAQTESTCSSMVRGYCTDDMTDEEIMEIFPGRCSYLNDDLLECVDSDFAFYFVNGQNIDVIELM